MSKAPRACPVCHNMLHWKKVDTSGGGFSVGKAAVGAVLLSPVGLVGGALGRKKVCYACGSCGFQHDYDA